MSAEIYSTLFESGAARRVKRTANLQPDPDGRELEVVNLYPEVKYQSVDGFGGAITAAVGDTLSRMPAGTAEEIMEAYFGPSGIGYRGIRTHLDSCDFSSKSYEAACSAPGGELRDFSIAEDRRRIIPYIRLAYRAAGTELPVMLTPWSPPAFMKTNSCRCHGGRLRREYYELWAEYICRYVLAYMDEGINVRAISVQNEPNAVQTWESCLYSAQEERDFLRCLLPALDRSGLGGLDVYIWDHNKERIFERACASLDEETRTRVKGLAFHWYSGDHFEALSLVRELFPEKKLLFSEGCIEFSRHSGEQLSSAQMYAHDMIGDFNHGMNTFIDWNIALDERGGPNHAENFCAAPVMCDTASGRTEYRLSFDYIGHFSSHIRPGARRIAVTRYTDKLEVCAFENPGGDLAAVVLNRSSAALDAYLRLGGRLLQLSAPPGSIHTVLIPACDR